MLGTLTGPSALERKVCAGARGEFEPLWALFTQHGDQQLRQEQRGILQFEATQNLSFKSEVKGK
jgi:hypothetical protein